MKSFLLKLDQSSSLSYRIRRSARAKRTRIVVSSEGIEVVAPLEVPEGAIKTFIEAQKHWIQTSLERLKSKNETIKPLAPNHYEKGASIPFQGELIPLNIARTQARTITIRLTSPQAFTAYIPTHYEQVDSDKIRSALVEYMKRQARSQAWHFIEKHSRKYSLIPRSLKIKTQRSRWGSCGPNNDLNLNWLLILAPPAIMEYVVIHELCHIRHKNHSKEFWSLVAEHMPNYLQHRNWLKHNGSRLMQGL